MAGTYKSPAIKLMGHDGIAAIVLLILGAWVVGWLMGGPEIRNRKVLAISSSMRNVGGRRVRQVRVGGRMSPKIPLARNGKVR